MTGNRDFGFVDLRDHDRVLGVHVKVKSSESSSAPCRTRSGRMIKEGCALGITFQPSQVMCPKMSFFSGNVKCGFHFL